MTIDHVIPERLEGKPELESVRRIYGLSADFVINGYCNWLPCHPYCNWGKGRELPPQVPYIFQTLATLGANAAKLKATEEETRDKFDKDEFLGEVLVAFESDTFTLDELVSKLPAPALIKDPDLQILREEIDLQVDQHYVDFLSRKPESDQLAYWTNQIKDGQLSDDPRHANLTLAGISAAFFLAPEFHEAGYLIYCMYAVAYGRRAGASTFGGSHQLSVPMIRLSEFLPAIQQIGQGVVVGADEWQTDLEAHKTAFALDFVSSSRFTLAYPTSLPPAHYVDALFANAGTTPAVAERLTIINEFGTVTTTAERTARARALRRVAESRTLAQQEFNKAFVLMLYFGYLRRNPDDAPDTDFSGYDFWLEKLNRFEGNFVAAEMTEAFITSAEYKARFAPQPIKAERGVS